MPTSRRVTVSLTQKGGAAETKEEARKMLEANHPGHVISDVKFEWAMPGCHRTMERYVGLTAVATPVAS
jgi:hypothetical protein